MLDMDSATNVAITLGSLELYRTNINEDDEWVYVEPRDLVNYGEPDKLQHDEVGEFVAYSVDRSHQQLLPMIATIHSEPNEEGELISYRDMKNRDVPRISGSNTPLESMQGGWIFQRLYNGDWAKRFMQIRGFFVILFMQPSSEKPSHLLHLSDCRLCVPRNNGKSYEKRIGVDNGWEFKLISSGAAGDKKHSIRFAAQSDSERNMWTRQLCARISLAGNQVAQGAHLDNIIDITPQDRWRQLLHCESPCDPYTNKNKSDSQVVITSTILHMKNDNTNRHVERSPSAVADTVMKTNDNIDSIKKNLMMASTASLSSRISATSSKARSSNSRVSATSSRARTQASRVLPGCVAHTVTVKQAESTSTLLQVQLNMGFEAGMYVVVVGSGDQSNESQLARVNNVPPSQLELDAPLGRAFRAGAAVSGFSSLALASQAQGARLAEDPSSPLTERSLASASEVKSAKGSKGNIASAMMDSDAESSSSSSSSSTASASANMLPPPPAGDLPPVPPGGHGKRASISLKSYLDPSPTKGGSVTGASTRSVRSGATGVNFDVDGDPMIEGHSTLLRKLTKDSGIFAKSMQQRNEKEEEGRVREQATYEHLCDPATIEAAQLREEQNPMDFTKLLRYMIMFSGFHVVEDTHLQNKEALPILKGEHAEKMMMTLYRHYTNETGFMSVEEFVTFVSDLGIVNTHCPHTQFDEPVMDVAENLDPIRLLTTIPKPSVVGIQNPEENVASAALQDALKKDRFVISFTQFYQILFKMSNVVYPEIYKKSRTEAFNKLLLESAVPLYAWKVGNNEKLGTIDPLLADERIALLLMAYAPNLWKLFLMYAGDIYTKQPSPDLHFPKFAQAVEVSLHGLPRDCPYASPLVDHRAKSSMTNRTSTTPDAAQKSRVQAKGNTIAERRRSQITLSSSKKVLNRRYSYNADIDLSHGSVRDVHQNEHRRTAAGEQVNSARSKEVNLFASEKTLVGKSVSDSAANTKAQLRARENAQFGLFINEPQIMKFCADYSIVHDLLSPARLKAMFRALNSPKNLSTGRVSTQAEVKSAERGSSSGLTGATMSMKLKSKRMSVVGSIDDMYGINKTDAVERGSLRKNPVYAKTQSSQRKDGGLSFTEFLEFIARAALEGMGFEHFDKLFPTPFAKIHAILTIWGVADTKKLEDALMLRVDIVL